MASAPQTANRYSYAQNNPFRYTDPSGRFIQAALDHPGEIVSLAISFSALPGLALAAYSAISGTDPFTGRTLSSEERTIGAILLAAIPIGIAARALAHVVGPALRGLVGLPSRAAGRLEELGLGLRGLRGAARLEREAGAELSEAARGYVALRPDTIGRAADSVPGLRSLASEIREAGLHPAARNNRTFAVGVDSKGNMFAGSSNGFDTGQRAALERLGITRVPGIRVLHAEEELLRGVPSLKRVGTSVRSPCGPAEHNCSLQLAERGVAVE